MSRASLKDEPSIEDILAAIRRQIADQQRASEAAEAAGGNGMWADEPADLCAWAPWPEALDPPAEPANDEVACSPARGVNAVGGDAELTLRACPAAAGLPRGRDPHPGRGPGEGLSPANDRSGAAVSPPLKQIGQTSSPGARCAPALALVRQAGLARAIRSDHSVDEPGHHLRSPARMADAGGVDIGRISAAELLDLGDAGTDQMQALLKTWLESNMPRLLAEVLGHVGDDGRRVGSRQGGPGT